MFTSFLFPCVPLCTGAEYCVAYLLIIPFLIHSVSFIERQQNGHLLMLLLDEMTHHFLQGISVEGQENIQEILTKQLVLCQYLCALSILRKGNILLLF